MPDSDRLAARLAAVERALTDGDHGLDDLPDAAALAERVDDVEERLGAMESDLAELEAAVRALRGYVGNLDAVNEAVERRADAALAHATDGSADLGGVGAAEGWRDAAAPAASREVDRAKRDESVASRGQGGPDVDAAVQAREDGSPEPGRESIANPEPGPGGLDPSTDAATGSAGDGGSSKTESRSVAGPARPSEPSEGRKRSRQTTGSNPQRRRLGEEWSGDRAERWLERHDADAEAAAGARTDRVDGPDSSEPADRRGLDPDPSLLDRFRKVF